VNSLFHYPPNMTFFTTRELLEIGDLPFTSVNIKPHAPKLEYYAAWQATTICPSTMASVLRPSGRKTAPL